MPHGAPAPLTRFGSKNNKLSDSTSEGGMYKCVTCIHHKVDVTKIKKCMCVIEKLNPGREDLFTDEDSFVNDNKVSSSILTVSGFVVSGSFTGNFSAIKHFHEWICTYHKKFLNCPGYVKDEA